MGPEKHPPSEGDIDTFGERPKMRMRFPAHIWAMLSCGKEAESYEPMVLGVDYEEHPGLARWVRWRENDGERSWKWKDHDRTACARLWEEHVVHRMVWVGREGRRYGRWMWETYEGDKEWDDSHYPRVNRRWLEMGQMQPNTTVPSLGGHIPQEVLLRMWEEFDWVCTGVNYTADTSHFQLQQWSMDVLATASGTCQAWLAICAPTLYRTIYVHSDRVDELIKDLSSPNSHIGRHPRELEICGPIPWQALPMLITLLPCLNRLCIWSAKEAIDAYHPRLSRLAWDILTAKRLTPALTKLALHRQQFSSAADVLRLFASFPRLLVAELGDCPLGNVLGAVPSTSAASLRELLVLCEDRPIGISGVACLAQWWQWPHPTTEPTIVPYPGLHRADLQSVGAMMHVLVAGINPA